MKRVYSVEEALAAPPLTARERARADAAWRALFAFGRELREARGEGALSREEFQALWEELDPDDADDDFWRGAAK